MLKFLYLIFSGYSKIIPVNYLIIGFMSQDLFYPVEFQNQHNELLGIGLVNYSSDDIEKIKGLKSNRIKQVLGHKSYDEVIHRDNLAITAEE